MKIVLTDAQTVVDEQVTADRLKEFGEVILCETCEKSVETI